MREIVRERVGVGEGEGAYIVHDDENLLLSSLEHLLLLARL